MTVQPLFVVLFALTGALVLWGMLTTSPRVPGWVCRHDKLMHFLAFAWLAVLAQAALPEFSAGLLWMGLSALGLLAEGLQHLSASRRFCWRDALANSFGAASMLLALHWLG